MDAIANLHVTLRQLNQEYEETQKIVEDQTKEIEQLKISVECRRDQEAKKKEELQKLISLNKDAFAQYWVLKERLERERLERETTRARIDGYALLSTQLNLLACRSLTIHTGSQ